MKTYVLDASALFAFLENEPGAHKVKELVKSAARGSAQIFMSAVNYGEVYGGFIRDRGTEQARSIMSAAAPLPITLVDATTQRAFQAAELKTRHRLYYADGFAAALSVEHKATLVTSDSDFRRLGHGFPIVWLK